MGDQSQAVDQSKGELMKILPPMPRGPLGRFFAQFGRPSGVLGQLAGWIMSRTDADDRWIVDLLRIEPEDRVLEIGFGPGVAVELLAARASKGLVAGVDPSAVMVRQAMRRNRAAVRAGRVRLRPGTAENLPYPDAHFTKALAVHSLYFWPSVDAGLRELHRVLAPGGLAALAVRMRHPDAGRFDPSRYGLTDVQVADVAAKLRAVGFLDVSTCTRVVGRQTITAILARR